MATSAWFFTCSDTVVQITSILKIAIAQAALAKTLAATLSATLAAALAVALAAALAAALATTRHDH